MSSSSNPVSIPGVVSPADLLLRADAWVLREWILKRRTIVIWLCVFSIIAGAGSYGAAIGAWRDSLQALYTGIKLPLVILLTTAGNGLLNGMLAPLLGVNVGFRQSFVLVLISFAVTSVILGALSPVALFVVWNTPPLTAGMQLSAPEYGFLQLTLATFIALAGITGNLKLLPLLHQWSRSKTGALNVLLAWLSVNLFLGSQISWVMRPFIWDPAESRAFIGRQYLRGSFYETVFNAAGRLIFDDP